MSRKIGLAAVLLILAASLPVAAITQCELCACSMACNALCFFSGGGTSTCGALGICAGSPSCSGGGGCLTGLQSDYVLKLLDQQPAPVGPMAGRAAARLTWRLAQFAEENGLGDTYTAGTRFAPRGAAQKLPSPDLAFVARGHQATTPDLVVQLSPAHADAAAAGWLGSGTRAVLVLDAENQTIEVYRRGQAPAVFRADALLELPDLLPGWSLRVGDLFQ